MEAQKVLVNLEEGMAKEKKVVEEPGLYLEDKVEEAEVVEGMRVEGSLVAEDTAPCLVEMVEKTVAEEEAEAEMVQVEPDLEGVAVPEEVAMVVELVEEEKVEKAVH